MANATTYYDTLQVNKAASDAVIRAAYRALSQKHHPDKNRDDLDRANRQMQRLNEAFAVLSDPVRRASYDEVIAEHANAGRTQTDETTSSRRTRETSATSHPDSTEYSRSDDSLSPESGLTSQRTTSGGYAGTVLTLAAIVGIGWFLSRFGTILLIAFLPAAAVVGVGTCTKSRGWTNLATAVAIGIAVFSGDPAFIFLDLAFVLAGYLIARRSFRAKPARVEPAPEQQKAPSTAGSWSVVLLSVAVAGYFAISSGSSPPKPTTTPAVVSTANPQGLSAVTPTTVAPASPAPTPVPAAASENVATPDRNVQSLTSIPAPAQQNGKSTVSVAKVEPQPNRRAYDLALKQIEARHPELNPDSHRYRPDLVDEAVVRMNEYVRQGFAKPTALVRAVADMEGVIPSAASGRPTTIQGSPEPQTALPTDTGIAARAKGQDGTDKGATLGLIRLAGG
jgi:hypothetical protein